MIDISYRNYSSATAQSRYQISNRNRKNSSNEAFKTAISGNAAYIEQTSVRKGLTWDDVKKIPGKYALKDGNSISVYHSTGNCGYKFYHAAESTDDSPVLDAKGVDEHGVYFEEKINVKQIARYDLNLSANWIIQCAGRYLQPLYDLMKEELLQSKYLHGDETRIQVIDEPDQKGSTQNWMWVYLTDEYSDSPRMVLFQYERTRAGYHPVKFLGDQFGGYFTCDGYQAYHSSLKLFHFLTRESSCSYLYLSPRFTL